MRLFRNHIRNPRYNIYFYHDSDVRYEMNGDSPWTMLGYLTPKFESSDLRPSWQILMYRPDNTKINLERDLFLGGSEYSKALVDYIEEAEMKNIPKEYLLEILVDHKSGEQVAIATKDNFQIGFIARLESLIKGTDHHQVYLRQKEKELNIEKVLESVFH